MFVAIRTIKFRTGDVVVLPMQAFEDRDEAGGVTKMLDDGLSGMMEESLGEDSTGKEFLMGFGVIEIIHHVIEMPVKAKNMIIVPDLTLQ